MSPTIPFNHYTSPQKKNEILNFLTQQKKQKIIFPIKQNQCPILLSYANAFKLRPKSPKKREIVGLVLAKKTACFEHSNFLKVKNQITQKPAHYSVKSKNLEMEFEFSEKSFKEKKEKNRECFFPKISKNEWYSEGRKKTHQKNTQILSKKEKEKW